MPGNKNPLLLTFSDLKAYLRQLLSWQTFTLSAPLQRGVRLLRYLRPLSCALAFSRPSAGSSSCRVPQFRTEVFSQPVVACCTPGVFWDNPQLMMKKLRLHTFTILVKCLNRFHLSQVTTRQTQVPLVNIGRRGSSTLLRSVPDARTLSAGFVPQAVPPLNARRFPLTSLSKCFPVGNTSAR